ncbi:sulfite exporter TauE/SafE family protein [Geomicrobium sp. JCM 19055]|uniref:sulfite exporter TauE/SafE family protein n=1 Tax=Geomicrobium sp. JCM 19055 TaxID=1460649 RepID=UPI00045ED269|nr:sulfite exporter TauE/SafE family protein [Geomicrobium sp. JCM 19055]GAK01747.1 hypothetical protein JCM19055_4953 [Geomicrobium sp. JCM 19055]
MIEFLIIFLIVLVGAIVQGISGFGIGLVMMAFLPLFLTVKESTLLVISLLIIAAVTVIIKNYQYIEWKSVRKIFIFALLGRIVAFFILTSYGDLDILQLYLGLFLIGMVIFMFMRERSAGPKDQDVTMIQTVTLGFFGGFIGGLFGVGGPFFVFYFLMVFASNKFKYLANVQFVTLLVSTFSISLHAINGDFNVDFIGYFLVGTVAVVIGTILGLKLFAVVNQMWVRRFAMILVLVAALNLILFSA